MGIFISKCYNKNYETPIQLRSRIQVLEGEIHRLKLFRERESQDYEEKEMAWRRERKKFKEEEARMRKKMKEDQERIKCLEVEKNECKEWQNWPGTEYYLVEHMKEEQAQREVAVEKWKQLYLTIKSELDDLIHRTTQEGRLGFGGEGLIDRLQTELLAKEESVEMLRSRLQLMEKEGVKKEREIDILRQSLRILNNTKRNGMRRNLQRRWLS